jgi:hypothetical protein
MERSGALSGSNDFAPMEPDEVAREGLANLDNGPVWVPGDANRAGFDYLRRVPRRDAVNVLSQAARTVWGLDPEPPD